MIYIVFLPLFDNMEFTEVPHTSLYALPTQSPTSEPPDKFDLSDYVSKNKIIIIIPSVFLSLFLIILFVLLIKRILNRDKFNPKQLETYSSVSYDDESLDEELGVSDDIMYNSCRLLVGDEYEENGELTNSEPEYDCMSVDVSVNANQSPIVDWEKNQKSVEVSQDISHSLKTLPHNFWKR